MYNVLKFHTPYERAKEYSSSPEMALYKSILIQAFSDASSISTKSRDERLKKQARDWICINGDYFQQICFFAGAIPSCVIAQTKKAIEFNARKHKDFRKKKYREMIA